ncbi:MAG: hypothetical protein ACYTFA_19010 [Planctomycetota bacterium]|jgi:HEAT repeat protein
MLRRSKVVVVYLGVLFALHPTVADAQPATSEDDIIRPIQGMSVIGESDQERIGRWVRKRVTELTAAASRDEPTAFPQFRERIGEKYQDSRNTQAFRTALTVQTTQLAVEKFADATLDATVAHALARVLVDLGGAETYAGLLAGLKSKDQSTRYLCARGLTALRSSIAQDTTMLDQTVAALREAGEAEPNAVVLSRIYLALAYTVQVEAVFDAYMSLLDKRLEQRRGSGVFVDRAELDAFDYFRQGRVIGALNGDQKVALVGRLAVFLRFDAQRYNAEEIGHDESANERESLERRLDGLEACLEALVGTGQGGDIRGELKAGGHERREAVLQQVYRWIGHPTTQTPGALNAAPWDVPIGAP